MAKVSELLVNGSRRRVDSDSGEALLNVLREDLGLTGSKYGCGEGKCGACTVLIDGLPVRSCVKTVGSVGQREITTIEGVASRGQLHPLQQAFLDLNVVQCGYCTSGMIMAGVALLRSKPNPSEQEIVEAMDGNVCRCGTYPRIIAAIQHAAKTLQETK
jgi:nicotinate dehydrogenase subunit A